MPPNKTVGFYLSRTIFSVWKLSQVEFISKTFRILEEDEHYEMRTTKNFPSFALASNFSFSFVHFTHSFLKTEQIIVYFERLNSKSIMKRKVDVSS